MRTIERSTAFKKDFKKVKSNPRYSSSLDSLVLNACKFLIQDNPLPQSYKDHALTGNWINYRECHLLPDLLLIYQKSENVLKLVRLGTHSDLFR